jgi:hypothetical protein
VKDVGLKHIQNAEWNSSIFYQWPWSRLYVKKSPRSWLNLRGFAPIGSVVRV